MDTLLTESMIIRELRDNALEAGRSLPIQNTTPLRVACPVVASQCDYKN